MSLCPCGSQQSFEKCCKPYIQDKKPAPTAEALMRSRYTAYTLANIDYIVNTHDISTRQDIDVDAIRKWARDAEWLQLEILDVTNGLEGQAEGIVEFKASYKMNGEICVLHEISQFANKQGKWFYVDGKLPAVKQFKRDSVKIGRNDPCSCGSGVKYKKCCGKAA